MSYVEMDISDDVFIYLYTSRTVPLSSTFLFQVEWLAEGHAAAECAGQQLNHSSDLWMEELMHLQHALIVAEM